jgi:hypothetical protein
MGQVISGTINTNGMQTNSNTTTIMNNKNNKNKILTGQPGNIPKNNSRLQSGGYTYKKKTTKHKTHKRRK